MDSLASRSYALPPQAKTDVTTMFRRVHPASISKKKPIAFWHFEAGGSQKHSSAALAVSQGEGRDRGTEDENPVVPERREPERDALDPLDEASDRLVARWMRGPGAQAGNLEPPAEQGWSEGAGLDPLVVLLL